MEGYMMLLPALLLSALLVLTHAYFGLHVLARGIIFVDLALAQIAALGASLALLIGEDMHGNAAWFFALGAALAAALGLTGLRRLPHTALREAVIGCVYVVATALTVVILSRSPLGLDQLRALLNGNILWAGTREIVLIGAVYAVLALLHGVRHRYFHALSFGTPGAPPQGGVWELVFFASFAVVITLAVQVAGVLLVFALLILPALSATLFTTGFKAQLLTAWVLGGMGCLLGLGLSYGFDLPSGPTMVCALGLLPLAALALRPLAGLVKARRASDD